MKDDVYRKASCFSSEQEREMKDLEVVIAKYYFPDELFVGQVKEIIGLLTERLAGRFPYDQAASKANQILEKYYLNTTET